ncbi:site-specific integrase [Hansschlegelia zhihuaiae]|uniref:Site-specific integrase n=1 Tax=Hansschlegelia zhihuaiae TaxID=405005 RepID=A0A4Q0M4C4_9HYPH|nr:site-specific integrase [Hansschlegelia zhihuaiae]RXF67549.1 site-specific integrase [Hansschlegelia zhihuaiae]
MTLKAPGLDWRKTKDGAVPYWRASRDAIKAGYDVKNVRLTGLSDDEIVDRCRRLQAEMLEWLDGEPQDPTRYDGTVRSLVRIFQAHPDSPFREKRHDTREFYAGYCRLLEENVGQVRVSSLTGPDIRRWYNRFAEPKKDADGNPVGQRRVRRAQSAIATFRRCVSFGVELKHRGCADLATILSNMRFAGPAARDSVLTLAHARAIIAKAHELGRPSIALAQAFAFDLTLRQKDIIGEWTSDAQSAAGGIVDNGRRWDWGLLWSHIDERGVLRKPTSKSNGRKVLAFDLSLFPLVSAEIERVAADRRVGPIVVNEHTGLPYKPRKFSEVWRTVATAAGVPADVWQMDSRAGGLTETTDAGADLETARHQAGHSNIATTARYSRGSLAKTSEVARLRVAFRDKNGVET